MGGNGAALIWENNINPLNLSCRTTPGPRQEADEDVTRICQHLYTVILLEEERSEVRDTILAARLTSLYTEERRQQSLNKTKKCQRLAREEVSLSPWTVYTNWVMSYYGSGHASSLKTRAFQLKRDNYYFQVRRHNTNQLTLESVSSSL
ncbi:hypothetical protein J6590_042517 [Homalodisca vitripennis]|nr:hypothetical protein J6590_042517 [Homalodisca vitripennis]